MTNRLTYMRSRLAAMIFIILAGAAAPSVLAEAPAAGDAVRGSRLFLQCQACHTVAPGAADTVGPNLFGVVGAKAASRPSYSYSPALAKAGIVWTPAMLDTWLKRPTAMAPGTRMAFAGIADAKSRADIIAYLAKLKAKK